MIINVIYLFSCISIMLVKMILGKLNRKWQKNNEFITSSISLNKKKLKWANCESINYLV